VLPKHFTLKGRVSAICAVVGIVVAAVAPAHALAAPSAVSSASLASGPVSYRQPDGMILSTANLYFTYHDASTASVWRTAQSSSPGQEALLYSEPGARFGDIVFALVDNVWWGYFLAARAGVVTIRRVPLAGGPAANLTPNGIGSVDIANSHRNLITDGVNLYWQDATSVRKMPIRGGASTVLDRTSPNTPTAGLALQTGNLLYASGTSIYYVPTGGSFITPLFRKLVTAASRVTTLYAVSNGIYWGEDSGAVRLKVGSTIRTLPSSPGWVPTSISTNGYTAGADQIWTQCRPQSCRLQFVVTGGTWWTSIGADALGATMTTTGNVFWGDSAGVHRQIFN
jgi:hypothetical protein